MFNVNDVYSRLKQQPFAPVRIVTSGGESYDVFHPDLVLVGRRFLEVGTASAEDPRTFDNVTRVSILHITALQDLPVPVAPGGNGQH